PNCTRAFDARCEPALLSVEAIRKSLRFASHHGRTYCSKFLGIGTERLGEHIPCIRLRFSDLQFGTQKGQPALYAINHAHAGWATHHPHVHALHHSHHIHATHSGLRGCCWSSCSRWSSSLGRVVRIGGLRPSECTKSRSSR